MMVYVPVSVAAELAKCPACQRRRGLICVNAEGREASRYNEAEGRAEILTHGVRLPYGHALRSSES